MILHTAFRAILIVGCLAWWVHPIAADDAQAFRQAKGRLQQRLNSRRTEDRVAAIRELAEYQQAEAARLIAQAQVRDASPEVREEAYEALLTFNAQQEVCDALVAMAKKDAAGKDPSQAMLLVAVLLNSQLATVEQAALDVIDSNLGPKKDGPLAIIVLADELSRRGREADLAVLEKLTRAKLFAADFGVRRAVVQAICNIQRKEAIAALLKLLPDLQGEVLADALHLLGVITGQALADDVAGWARWWKDNQQSFVYPVSVVRTQVRTVPLAGVSSYYGLPIYAQRLVFVMDTSGSMTGPRLAAAKRELVRAIMGLKEGAFFTIVVFNDSVLAWQKRLVPASSASRRAAVVFVEGQMAQGNTASYNALEMAIGFDAEAIYFLTDGAPTGGKIVAPVEIVAAIARLNRAKRESIYSIGIGVGPEGNPFDLFLAELAEQNFGVYRRVDE